MTAGKRVEILHKKMSDRKLMKERRKTGAIGAAGMILTVCLIFIVFSDGMLHSGGPPGLYSGSIMLFAEAGPYILVAIVAFMAGVIVTILIKRYKNRRE